MNNSLSKAQVAITIRTARTAVGWNQQELADRLGISKSTIARIETMQMSCRGDIFINAIQIFKEVGIKIDFSNLNFLILYIETSAIKAVTK